MKLNERFKHGYEFTIETGEKYFIAEIDVESTRVDYWCYPVSIKDKLEKHPTFTHDDVINEQYRIILNEGQLYELALRALESRIPHSISLNTPIGKLEACVGGDFKEYPVIYTYLVRPDGAQVDLAAVEWKEDREVMRAHLYGSVQHDSPTYSFDWSKGELMMGV